MEWGKRSPAAPVPWVMATPQLAPMSWPLPRRRRVRAPRGCGLAAPLPISCRIYRGMSGSPAKFHYYTCSLLRLAVKHSGHSLHRQAGADVPSTPSGAPREALSRCLPLGAGGQAGQLGPAGWGHAAPASPEPPKCSAPIANNQPRVLTSPWASGRSRRAFRVSLEYLLLLLIDENG